MVASLTLPAYFENDYTPEVSGRKTRLYPCDPVDVPGKSQMSSADRLMQILNNSVADMDDDETLLTGKDRINIFAVNIF
ncbi:MAG: hypothetical protein J0H29_24680 [Sphingobacteriales bacterium]|nr:hypothetical protein [Sphingobacteriales bacterium]OJY87971.1 MAG: hypothetical protein BGP14_21225 [Sphingobacteriales bacterium 44-15]